MRTVQWEDLPLAVFRCRVARGLDLRAASEGSGVSRAQLSKIERDVPGFTRADTLQRLAEWMGVRIVFKPNGVRMALRSSRMKLERRYVEVPK